jgi:hypothetical protein
MTQPCCPLVVAQVATKSGGDPVLGPFGSAIVGVTQDPEIVSHCFPDGHPSVTQVGWTQTPEAQTCPSPHAVPQVPQFAVSLLVSVHDPPQSDWPEGQAHVPAPQTWPPWQTAQVAPLTPQAPVLVPAWQAPVAS